MKTAVEWLFENLDLTGGCEAYEALEKAKEMEKQQIINAHNSGYSEGIYQSCESGEQYYNETFKSE